MKKDNTNRFIQDMDGFRPSSAGNQMITEISEPKEFLENGTIVNLINPSIKNVEIIERICIVDGKYYDYKGEYADQDGKKETIYFMICDME